MGFIFNTVKRLIKIVLQLSLYLVMIVTVITLIPNLPPYTKFTSIEVSPIQPLAGPLALNSALNNAGRSYSGKLLGPEAFQVHKGELYTSLATGEIVKLTPEGHVTFVTTVGQPCSGLIHEHICGRPLGIQIDENDESLYVADAYHGIWKVNLKTNKKQLLVSPRVEIEKRRPKLFNSIALAKNGDFYWTDSSSDFHLKDGVISLMTDPAGRLFHYDAARNQSKVLLDNLWFANGVVLSPNNDFVVVSESFRARMMKYYISGPKKGQSEVFVDGLPGIPDNARALPDGSGLLVAMYSVYEDDRPPLAQLLAATPVVRKVIARLHRLIEIPFEYLNTIYPHIVFEEIVYFIGHFKSLSGVSPALSGLLQIDWDGNIVGELRRLPLCADQQCCNPYHWSRLCKPETPPPPYSRYAMEDLKPKEHGESTEDARRTDHERLVSGSLATDGEERQSWESEWCRLAYWELTQRVGRQFGVRVRAVDVFGGGGGTCGSGRHGLCLDALDQRGDAPQVEQVRKTRAKIGLGVTLSLESDGVWLYNRSQEPVFVSSPALDAAAAKALLVWRVAPGHCLCIFDPSCPPPAVSLPHIGPVDPRSVRISFAKGWGPKYSRRDVTACPCWLEVLLAPPS